MSAWILVGMLVGILVGGAVAVLVLFVSGIENSWATAAITLACAAAGQIGGGVATIGGGHHREGS